MSKLEDVLSIKYYAAVHEMVDCDTFEVLYYAYLPDFGHSACSAVGDSEEEALTLLKSVKDDVIYYFLERGRETPEPLFRSNYPLPEDPYADIRKLTEEDCEEIYKFAMQRSKEILEGDDDD
jgi:predicted RNase H-like HicB family nuclease